MSQVSQASMNSLDRVVNEHKVQSNGLKLTKNQSTGVPSGILNEIIIIPSTSAPVFNSMFIIDIKETNIILHNITLQFNLNTLTASGTAVTNYPFFTPAMFFFQRIEICQNNVVVDTIYPTQQFLRLQFEEWDEDRLIINNGIGNYSSALQRYALASSSGTTNYLVNLKTYFDQTHLPILSQNHQVQLRVYMDSLANNVNLSTLTAPVSTLNFCNAICKISRLPTAISTMKIQALQKQPSHSFFHDVRYGLFSIQSGVTSSQIVLTPIVGKVATLFFVVRNVTGLANDNYFKFNAIKDFAILNSSSTNIVGGQSIPSVVALQYLNLYWSRSSYTSENALGITNNNANVYCWSFSSDPLDAMATGKLLGSKQFTGAEQLQLNFTSATPAGGVQVDVYAMTESIIELGHNYVKKLSV